MDIQLIVLAVVVVLALLLVKSVIVIVPQGYNYTVENFGRYTKTLTSGLHILVPFIQRVGRKMNMMEQVIDIPGQEVITRDNAMVTADAVAFIQVMDAPKAAYEVNNLINAITNLSMTNIRSVIGNLELDEVLSNRDEINSRLLMVIDAATNPWGVKVTRVEIKDLLPPADITEAMARQMKAERLKRAEILQADGDKQSAILRAEGEKQSAILEAEGRKQAAFADAEAREREAEAEANATKMVSESIAEGDIQAINYFIAQKYVEAFESLATAPNQKFVLLPTELTNLAGTVGGIGALLGQKDSAPKGPWTNNHGKDDEART
ncbi:SPFH domain-containing protein [Parvularcula lutaonensis]|uniref:Protein QmcA n=1 Tax=Parvularcula lutaonensis TaxID=491923 RepID=A0ABV7M873_9PROT|nr:SPFH domain-containing protein [Parvularcula lutaonensis]GGY43993.1 paraslipin [Parvularcula lutaonensis]